MGERTASVDIANRPDTRNIGSQLVIDRNEVARVGLETGFVGAKIVGVGTAPDREQKVRPFNLVRSIVAA